MKLTKIALGAAAFASIFFIVSCASGKVAEPAGDKQVGDSAMVEATFGVSSETAENSDSEEEKTYVIVQTTTSESAPASQETSSVPQVQAVEPSASQPQQQQTDVSGKGKSKQKKDPYTGWVYIPEKNFSITNGDVKLTLRGDTGSFGIYVIPETGHPVPVLSTYDSFCSSFFSLKIGRKEYRLNRENGVKSEARRTPYGGQMAYTIDNQAQIVVDFSFLPSIATSSRVDMLRVTVYTINLGRSTQSFTVKAVFDTLLGENAYTHFATAAHSRIDTEKQYLDMSSEKWVRSYNEKAAIQFLLNGKGITDPQAVTMSNKDLLSQPNWMPSVQEERSFSSVLSYNNSALGINWNPAYLDPLKSDIITFYISVASDGNEPAGKEFLATLAEGRTALSANLPAAVETTTVAPPPQGVSEDQLSTAYREGMPVIADGSVASSPVEENSPSKQPSSFVVEDSDDSISVYSNGKTTTSSAAPESSGPSSTPANSDSVQTGGQASVPPARPVINDSRLDPEYVQRLLDRIQLIELNPSLATQAELDALNAELDEILMTLRSSR